MAHENVSACHCREEEQCAKTCDFMREFKKYVLPGPVELSRVFDESYAGGTHELEDAKRGIGCGISSPGGPDTALGATHDRAEGEYPLDSQPGDACRPSII